MADMIDRFALKAARAIKRMGQLVTVDGKIVRGIFEDDYQPIVFDQLVFESNAPMLIVATSDVTHATNAETAIIDDVTYTIAEIRNHQGGVTEYKLKESS